MVFWIDLTKTGNTFQKTWNQTACKEDFANYKLGTPLCQHTNCYMEQFVETG
jgi:hypothetical protein